MALPKRTVKFRPIVRPRMMLVRPASQELPGSRSAQANQRYLFTPDGFIFARPQDTQFDVIIRVATLAASTTATRLVFTQEERIKSGWIRGLGYGFNNPHGFFQVRTALLINGGPPSNYIFKTVDDATGTGQYQGSFPTVQLGTIQNPTDVYISLPSNAQVELRFVNNSTTETFSAVVRLKGWSLAG